ncbi:very-long-chain (3R)-3-hydroxyacyl-CoA dehydratase [Coccinella septempunctata]|uniref:very-long-chain (3R)-3-hydroxyacyl-CoA dehydratase n=1 Tax=Coccinella septempunctata TaxID=41139 RepID=UPI001D081EA5|nr:very-long-chain (3R)-3-hydroxyacyl-CoA dehydratase [Coccinella septempunctata]
MTSPLNPFVYWAQNDKNVFLKVELNDSQDVRIELEDKYLDFSCQGNGARGNNRYCFHVDFYDDINKNDSKHKITDKNITFVILKQKKEWWPRLLSQPQKQQWLKIDFDRWQSPEDLSETNERVGDIYKHHQDIFEKLQKEEYGYKKEDARKVYLTCYNFFMYLGFLYIWVVLMMKFLKDGTDFFPKAYEHVSTVFYIMQTMQLVEIAHPILGLMKGGIIAPFIQVGGRVFVLFLMIGGEPKVQTEPIVFILFLAWSSIEIIRYPYYISQLFEKNNKLLTWLRYNAWIILYPVGMVCEMIINYKNLVLINETGKWSIEMPNPLNFTFSFVYVLRFYLLVLTVPTSTLLLRHMYIARKHKLGDRKVKKKD